MRKYVVHKDAYIFDDGPSMKMIEVEDNEKAILAAHETNIDDMRVEWDDPKLTVSEMLEIFIDENGEGGPYVTIFSIDDNEIIFG